MNSIEVLPYNQSFVRLNIDRQVAMELSEHFSFLVPGFRFMPKFKMKLWDGRIRLFNVSTCLLPKGLSEYSLKKFCYDNGYEYVNEIYDKFNISEKTIDEQIQRLNIHLQGKGEVKLYDYQIKAVKEAIQKQRIIIESPTSSGKSLIIYAILKILYELNIIKKVIILVPTISLTNQLYSDFLDYSVLNGWNIDNLFGKSTDGKIKDMDKFCVISTWQSVYKEAKRSTFFKNFDCIVVDEVHLAEGASLTNCVEAATNASFKIGLTGTLKEAKSHRYSLEGMFGRPIKMITTKQLMENKVVSSLQIQAICLQYEECYCRPSREYKEEIDFICSHNERNKFILNLCSILKGNTLLLFQFIEKHGKVLESIIRHHFPERPIF
ncbi:MAG: DEAD/DEAH box helicase family protein, partial [Epsilonproteobacteria bacterium]|nr:DEAD/DEAH box helicase family protein [Campylobacterota bacterium]